MLYKCSTNKAELISKTIVANGIYDASSSNADGFHSVTVNVPKQINVDEIEITENGVYNSSTNELDGYDKVTVAVEPNVDSKDISQNGTYNASDDGLDGYSSITVDVEGGGAELGTKNITENGTYDAGDDNLDGYSSVTVNVSGGGNLGTKTITANGTYNASADNLDGYSEITVNVPSVPEGYTVASWITPTEWNDYLALTNLQQYQNKRRGFLIIAESIITTYVYNPVVYNFEQVWDIREVSQADEIISVNGSYTYTKANDGVAFGMSVWYLGYTGMIILSKNLDSVEYKIGNSHFTGSILGVDSKGNTWYRSSDAYFEGGNNKVFSGLPLHIPNLQSREIIEDFCKLMICIHENDFTLFNLMNS